MLHIKKTYKWCFASFVLNQRVHGPPLSDEIHHNNMQNYMGQNEIGESPFR